MTDSMKDSGVEWIGATRNDWGIFKLNQLYQETKKKNIGLIETNLLSLSYGNIVKRNIDSNEGLLPESFEGYNIIESGDIVLRMTDLQNDQKSLRVGLSNQRGIITSAYITLRNKNSIMDDRYTYFFLYSFDICKGFYGMGAGVRQSVNFNDLKSLEILVPKIEVQSKISDFLEEKTAQINSVIFDTKDSIVELKKYKESLISETVTMGLNSNVGRKKSGVDWIKEIPTHWDMINSKRLFTERKEKASLGTRQLTASQKHGIIYQDEFMKIENQKVVTVEKGHSILKQVEPNDFVISMRSFQGGLEYSRFKGSISSAYVMLIPTEMVYPSYFRWLLKSSKYINALKSTSNLVRDGQAMRYSNFAKIPLFRIPIEEQKEIAKFLDEKCAHIDSLIEQKQRLLVELETYKKSLIYEYVTGKKEVL